jgi:hypothetical protein
MQKGTPESLESSAAHLDILSAWKGIASRCASIAYQIIQMDERPGTKPSALIPPQGRGIVYYWFRSGG